MRLAFVHARLQVLELVRLPAFSIATLAFPAVFFLLFGLPRARAHPQAFLASYTAIAVLGVGFFQFGVSIAIERVTPWQAWVRTLPASAGVRIAGRVLAALTFASASSLVVAVTVLATTPAWNGALPLLRLVVALLAGSVPFVALGLVIAYWSSPRAALPVANLLYIVLAYLGGLWSGPQDVPRWLAGVAGYTPTHEWGVALRAAVSGAAIPVIQWAALAGYAALFGGLAAWGQQRDEGQRFR